MQRMDFSAVAVSFQAAGTLLVGIMLAQLGRIFAWHYARLWAWAWTAMVVALVSVRIYISSQHPAWWFVYLFAEWAFLLLLFDGCRELAEGLRFNYRYMLYALPLAGAVSVALTILSRTFNDLFVFQASVVAIGLAASFLELGRIAPHRRTTGWKTMRIALLMMTALFAAYVPLYGMLQRGVPVRYLEYSSLADLLVSILLAFSMILVAFEEANRELRGAFSDLQTARDQLEQQVRTDPLTQVMNRHAFYTMQRTRSGVVLMVDVDHLKQINDQAGHEVGDDVIRAAANALRARIRADDLLFRWGGDEFLVILPGATMDLVQRRLSPLLSGCIAKLRNDQELPFTLSWGGAPFSEQYSLEEAMRAADATMYARRLASRAG